MVDEGQIKSTQTCVILVSCLLMNGLCFDKFERGLVYLVKFIIVVHTYMKAKQLRIISLL